MGDPYWSDEKFVNTTDNVFRNTVDNVFFDSSTPNKSGTRPTIRGGTKVVLPTTGLGIGVVNQDYARKPYLAKSYDEMMRRSTYRGAYNQVLMRQSEFEKPYLEDDYQEMQHFFAIPPLPPWGDWDWIPPEGTSGLPGGPKPGISSGFCDITCWDGGSWYGDPCEEALGDCHLAVSTLGIGGTWTVTGPVKKIEYFRDHIQSFPAEDIKTAKSIYIHADWDNIEKIDDKKEAEFRVIYTDERGNRCETEVTISCIEKCDCYKTPVFAYSGSNPGSMGPNLQEQIVVTNGCSPFAWSVTGGEFAFTKANTDTGQSLLKSEGSCSDGSITVVDNCGAQATGTVTISIDTFTYDAGNPTSIARNGDATITVTGGVGDYIWAVTGTGFSFASATTTTGTNTLSADNTACGTASITVTDNCSTEVTGKVMCTTGTWTIIEEGLYSYGTPAGNDCYGSTDSGEGNSDCFDTNEYLDKDYVNARRWRLYTPGCLGIGSGSCDWDLVEWSHAPTGSDPPDFPTPNLGNPVDCAQESCGAGTWCITNELYCNVCFFRRYDYQEWRC